MNLDPTDLDSLNLNYTLYSKYSKTAYNPVRKIAPTKYDDDIEKILIKEKNEYFNEKNNVNNNYKIPNGIIKLHKHKYNINKSKRYNESSEKKSNGEKETITETEIKDERSKSTISTRKKNENESKETEIIQI